MGTTELLWLKILLKDIDITVDEPMKMFCDNKATINPTNNPVMHDHTKHVEIDRHFIRKKIDSKELILPYVKLKNQAADVFTKGLSCRDFKKNVSNLSMFDLCANLRGSAEMLGRPGWD